MKKGSMDKELATYVVSATAGADVLKLITYLKKKQHVSEFTIAKALKQEINVTRNQLYRLLDINLIGFIRKKDKEKGWYIYYWTLKLQNASHVFWDMKKKKLQGFKDRLAREKNNFFFHCTNNCIRLDFDTAISYEYKCPECGELLNQQQTHDIVKDIMQQIKDLELEITKGKIIVPKEQK